MAAESAIASGERGDRPEWTGGRLRRRN